MDNYSIWTNPDEGITNAEARTAVERLLSAVWQETDVSLRLARFLLSTHGVHSEVDFGLFGDLNRDDLAAAEVAMRYAVFERRRELPLEWEEAQELATYWKDRNRKAR